MAHETEAACLLRTGHLYRARLGLKPAGEDVIFAGIKRGAFSLYFGDEPSYHIDLEGRWQRAFIASTHYRKTLDGRVVAIDRIREDARLVLHRRTLSYIEISDLDERVRQTAIDLMCRLVKGGLEPVSPSENSQTIALDTLEDLLDRVLRWDADAWFRLREQYCAAYSRLPVLPPDAQHSVILQATIPEDSRIKTAAEFETHARAVAKLLGRRLAQYRNVLLTGADVLHLPLDQVVGFLETASAIFPSGGGEEPKGLDEVRLAGFDMLLGDLRDPLPDRDGWRRLGALGLRRLNLMVGPGRAGLRGDSREDVIEIRAKERVAEARAAGVALSVVAFTDTGAGSEDISTSEREWINLLRSFDLTRGDVIYLMNSHEATVKPDHPGPVFSELPIRIKEALADLRARSGVKVIPHDPERPWAAP